MADGLMPAHRLLVDARCYTREVVFRTCYAFTDRCYVWLERVDDDQIAVSLTPRAGAAATDNLAGDFGNALIDFALRAQISRDTAAIRDSLMQAAMAGLGRS